MAVYGVIAVLAVLSLLLPVPSTRLQQDRYIEADLPTQQALTRAMSARGGRQRLLSVRSSMVEGSRKIDGGPTEPFTYRVLWPGQFQEVSQATYTIDGADFWSRPAMRPTALDLVARAKRKLFAEQSLLLTLRGTPEIPLTGTLATVDWAGTPKRGIRLTGKFDFEITLVLEDASGAAIGYLQPGQFGNSSGKIQTAIRRVTFLNHIDVDGVQVPAKMSEDIAGFGASVELSSVKFDIPLTPEFFRQPK